MGCTSTSRGMSGAHTRATTHSDPQDGNEKGSPVERNSLLRLPVPSRREGAVAYATPIAAELEELVSTSLFRLGQDHLARHLTAVAAGEIARLNQLDPSEYAISDQVRAHAAQQALVRALRLISQTHRNPAVARLCGRAMDAMVEEERSVIAQALSLPTAEDSKLASERAVKDVREIHDQVLASVRPTSRRVQIVKGDGGDTSAD